MSKKILYLTNLGYQAKGRRYHEEDLLITSRLMPHFNISMVHPKQAHAFLETADLLVFRNTGPVMDYQDEYTALLHKISEKGIKTFNSFDGKGDMKGKNYLIRLTGLQFPVIPTVEHISEIDTLGITDKYIVKIKDGADSIGMHTMKRKELEKTDLHNKIIQPFIDFEYEISFYYINHEFQYALYAPDKNKRWELKEIEASAEDLAFADQFINWNGMTHGITRVDACRLKNGDLLLVELEDLNPFLSIQNTALKTQEFFLNNFISAINKII